MPPPETSRSATDPGQPLRDLAAACGAELVLLFGSRAAGTDSEGADIDLALDYAALPGPEDRLRIIGRFQEVAGAVPVDVVFLTRDTDPVLRFEVLRSAHLLFEARPGCLTEARVRALVAYEDAIPLRRARRQRLHRAAQVD